MKENKWQLNLFKNQRLLKIMLNCGFKIMKTDKPESEVSMNKIMKFHN